MAHKDNSGYIHIKNYVRSYNSNKMLDVDICQIA